MKRRRVPGTFRPRIPDPVACDLECPGCGHRWVQPLVPAAHVFLVCPSCDARLEIGAAPPERGAFTHVQSR